MVVDELNPRTLGLPPHADPVVGADRLGVLRRAGVVCGLSRRAR